MREEEKERGTPMAPPMSMPVQAVAFLTVLNVALFAYSILTLRGANHPDLAFERAFPAPLAGASGDSGECWKSQLARAQAIYEVR